MCGIVGYLGFREAYPLIINGLKRLEYRGYDSAGILLAKEGDFQLSKHKGKVALLEERSLNINQKQRVGVGHTRWATHGEPSDLNAHPHLSASGNFAIVHNGIIENYDALRTFLENKGYKLKSETDTEILINLIDFFKSQFPQKSLLQSVRLALTEVYGAYAIAIMDKSNENQIIVARLGSPLVIGLGEKEFFVASDVSPFIEFTKEVIYLDDGEMACITRNNPIEIRKIKSNDAVDPNIQKLKMDLEEIEKGGYDHFMLKEIYEQPKSIRDTLRGRLLVQDEIIAMAGINDHIDRFKKAKRIIIVACGTSWHSALIGEYLLEDLARIPVEVEYASEFRYRNPIIFEDDIVIAITQSGETADTLAAIKLAKQRGAFVFAINNVVGSSIARISDAGAYTHAGPEIGVASTKAFTAQVAILALIAMNLGKQKGTLDLDRYRALCKELDRIPEKVEETLKQTQEVVQKISAIYKGYNNVLYLGRGINFPVALEGALKLKEISYIHAEGYPAAEMKHGPIALIDENMPVFVIATKRGAYEKVVSNIQEIKARKGKIISVVTQGDKQVRQISEHIVSVPDTLEELSPIINTVPLQLLAYHIAVMRGTSVDQPRNLAKSVTVE